MRERIFNNQQAKHLEKYENTLSLRYPNSHPVSDQEKNTLREAIKKIVWPFPDKLGNYLFYINQETADLLAGSSHAALKTWGKQAQDFYASDKMKKYVQPQTGAVMPDMNKINVTGRRWYIHNGNAVWSINNNSWSPTPGTIWEYGVDVSIFQVHCRSITADMQYPPRFNLVSPMHIASAIGDRELMEYLASNTGNKIDNQENLKPISPLECALLCDQEEMVDFLMKKLNPTDALMKAVEKANFFMIKKLLKEYRLPVTDEILSVALKRDHNLFMYLDLKRMKDVQKKLDSHGNVYKTLKSLLDYPGIPVKSLVDLICLDPEIIVHSENETDGNTLLHQLIIAGDILKTSALLEAIFQAELEEEERVDFSFDIDRKNAKGQTLLNLALAQTKNELVSVVLQYGPTLNEMQQKQIIDKKIDVVAIQHEKDKRENRTKRSLCQQVKAHNRVLQHTVLELIDTRQQVLELKNQVQMQHQMLCFLMQQAGFQPFPADESAEISMNMQTDNPSRFFLPLNRQNNSIAQPEHQGDKVPVPQ